DGFPGLCAGGEVLPIGSRGFDSEKLIAYEWGLRYTGAQNWSADLASFYNDYRDLRSAESGGTFYSLQNHIKATGAGAEIALNWDPLEDVALRAHYAFLDLSSEKDAESNDDADPNTIAGGSPRHQAGLRLLWQPCPDWAADSYLRYVGAIAQSVN